MMTNQITVSHDSSRLSVPSGIFNDATLHSLSRNMVGNQSLWSDAQGSKDPPWLRDRLMDSSL